MIADIARPAGDEALEGGAVVGIERADRLFEMREIAGHRRHEMIGCIARRPRARFWTAPRLVDELAERHRRAARLRGDTSHRKEEARAVLALRQDAARALPLARDNWAEQREPADARVLLEVALAARDKAAAAPALKWLADNRVESVQLRALADRVGALQ